MPKVKQKISGFFRTTVSADNFCVIRTCLDTLRKQGPNMLEVLRRAFLGNPIAPTSEQLNSYHKYLLKKLRIA